MDSFLEPNVPVSPPDWLIALAATDSRIVVNLRPDQWSPELWEKYRADCDGWKTRSEQHSGLLMHPALTQFLAGIGPGTNVVVCRQQTNGWEPITLVGRVSAVTWVGSGVENKTGVPAQIHFENGSSYGGSVWGHYVLAIARVHPSVTVRSSYDPFGNHLRGILKRSALFEQALFV